MRYGRIRPCRCLIARTLDLRCLLRSSSAILRHPTMFRIRKAFATCWTQMGSRSIGVHPKRTPAERQRRLLSFPFFPSLLVRLTLGFALNNAVAPNPSPVCRGWRKSFFRAGVIELEFGECDGGHGDIRLPMGHIKVVRSVHPFTFPGCVALIIHNFSTRVILPFHDMEIFGLVVALY
ncbi:hypothetical protein BCR34DRAFT_97766 [Clohesyomyces aquaticus]|uniref:Uncharacterized protein n=1 Tax=Clohesyomyces aquaticus TaxID=1231657 RepID=A0A1Y2A2A0_9PLEO|nr:hypothetical protein BCR34DRAFT_97766 [Clohesyomyces aquaticus]